MGTPHTSWVAPLRRRTRNLVVWGAVTGLIALASCGAVGLQVHAIVGLSPGAADLTALAIADRAAVATSAALVLVSLVGLALMARWIHTAYSLAGPLGLGALPMTASRAAWGFVLPVVQVWRPLRALAGLTRSLDVALAAQPAPRAAADASGHYRDNAAEPKPDARPAPAAPFAAAWSVWWLGWGLSYVATYSRLRVATVADLRASLGLDLASQIVIAIAALLLASVASGLDARVDALVKRQPAET